MLYTAAESIKQLSAFMGHPGIEKIIKGLQEIASGRHDETTIPDLRRALNAILDDDGNGAIMAGRISLVREVYKALMLLAELFPLNQEDTFSREPFTPEEIENGGLIRISTGHQFELASLAEWINEGPYDERKAYSNPATGAAFHPFDQEAIYQRCSRAEGIFLISPEAAAEAEEAPTPWVTFASQLEATLLQSGSIDDAQVHNALNIAAQLAATIQSIADHGRLTVDTQELANWQAAAWQALSSVLDAAPQEAVPGDMLEIANEVAVAARTHATDDLELATDDALEAQYARQTTAWQAVFALLARRVRANMQEPAVGDAVAARATLEKAVTLLVVAIREAWERGFAVDTREAAALLIGGPLREAVIQRIVAGTQAMTAVQEAFRQAFPGQNQQLPPVAPQSDFFQPELPVCRIIELSQESCAPWIPIIGCKICRSKCVGAFDIRCLQGDCVLSVYAGNSDSSGFPFASTPDRNLAFKNKLLEAGFSEEGRSGIRITSFPSAGDQGSNVFVMRASIDVMNRELRRMLDVIKKLEGSQVFTATEEQILGSLQPLSSQNNPPVHGLM